VAEIFFATADGELADGLGRFRVQNGVVVYQGPSRPQGLFWALRIVELNSGGAVFRCGPRASSSDPTSRASTS
jgi:hypothetical protein